MSVGSTTWRSVQVSGFAFNRMLTPPHCLNPLRVPRTSALPSASFRAPVTRGTLAVQLALPLVGCAEDFHLQVSAPCQAHDRRCAPVSNSAFGEVVEPACYLSAVRIFANRRTLTIRGIPAKKFLARPDGFEPPTTWFEGRHSIIHKSMIRISNHCANRLIFPPDMSP
jgi:hypothetical protein